MLTIDLNRISQISAQGQRVQNLAHLIDVESLKEAHNSMDGKKAVGVDKVSKEEYGLHLMENLNALVSRMKGGTFSPQPSRRTYIDKPGTNKKRPLAISCYEDKLVERVIAEILNAVYEPKFLDCSYGFRPGRNCHQAISKCLSDIRGYSNYIVEADIRSCFDTLELNWIIKFLEQDIADKQFIEIIHRLLKAGYIEANLWHPAEEGSAQGSGFSPCIANVYLHNVLDTWFARLKAEGRFRGNAWLIRYADDFVCGFQYKSDAERFYRVLPKRFGVYGLTLAEEKTRILNFGRFAAEDCKKWHEHHPEAARKPGTFDFLGFTFYCSTSWHTGKFMPKVKSASKRFRAKVAKMKEWLKANRNLPQEDIIKHINQVFKGYDAYYAVTSNFKMVYRFHTIVKKLLFKWLNRRSQRKSYTWDGFIDMLKAYPLLQVKTRVEIYSYYRVRTANGCR